MARRLSTSVSTRDTKNDATLAMHPPHYETSAWQSVP
jgi:hypothetical protein